MLTRAPVGYAARNVLLAVLRGFDAVGADMIANRRAVDVIVGGKSLDLVVAATPRALHFGNRDS